MKAQDALYLLAAPSFYGFSNDRLQMFCKQILETKICVDNVLDIFESADRIRAIEMKRHALKLIVRHYSQIAERAQFANLSKYVHSLYMCSML